MIILTLDLDWAPDYMLDYSFSLLCESGIKTTLFASHDSSVIRNVEKIFEIGLHPNIVDPNNIDSTIYELKTIFPKARCIRNHSLVSSSRFFPVYEKYDLLVTSNYIMINWDNIKPIPMLYGIYEYPIYYMDDVHLITSRDFDPKTLIDNLTTVAGLKVIAFHPVHIYLNSNNIKKYEPLKELLDEKTEIDHFVNKGMGIGTIFKTLIFDPKIKEQATDFPKNSTDVFAI